MNTQQRSNKKLTRDLSIIIVVYLAALLSTYASGYEIIFYLLLATIPMFFVGWGMSVLFAGKQYRQIERNLTPEEKEQLTEMGRNYGRTAGHSTTYFVIPFAVLCVLCIEKFGTKSWPILIALTIILVAVSSVVTPPEERRQRRKMKEFLLSTKYAREIGLSKEKTQSLDAPNDKKSRHSPCS